MRNKFFCGITCQPPLDDDVMIADVEVSSGVHDGRNTHAKMRRVHEMASELT